MICATCREEIEPSERCTSCHGPALLNERWALEEELGSGARSTTYRARLADGDGTPVVIKELLLRRLGSFEHEKLFRREVAILGQLAHPKIPAHFDAFVIEQGKLAGFYSVREHVEGEPLAACLRRGPLSPAEAATIGAELLEVLAYLHALAPPVVHRDVSPANVLRRPDGSLALIDFGSVKDSISPEGSTVTGTFGYMAPEVLIGRATPASDIYSVGALVVALCAGCAAGELVDRDGAVDPRRHVPHRGLARLLDDMLSAEPQRRPADAAALAVAMRAVVTRPERRGTTGPLLMGLVALAAGALWLGSLTATQTDVEPAPLLAPPPETATAIAPPAPVIAPPAPAIAPPPPLEPPRPPEHFDSDCAERGDCLDLADGFLGVRLDHRCGPLVPRGAPGRGAVRVASREPFPLDVGGRALSCVAEQQNGSFCNVLCRTHAAPDAADELVTWVGNRFGVPATVHTDRVGPNLYERYGIPPLAPRRSWTWGERAVAGPALLVQSSPQSADRVELVVSYRGMFRANG